MGNKINPIGFRIGITKDWRAKWYADKGSEYKSLVTEDLKMRDEVMKLGPDAGVSSLDLERDSSEVTITIHTSRPGIVIGRSGQKVEEIRKQLQVICGKRVRINVQEIKQPELDAFLIARSIADQLERRIAFRRAMKQTMARTMQSGALGVKVIVAGRLGGADIARTEKALEGRVPLHTLRADIDYGLAEAATDFGVIGVKAWVYKGDVVPEEVIIPSDDDDMDDMSPIEITVSAQDAQEEKVIEDATT
jgi:small subunit ribosomal protein S3